jgi:hypothetical protein
MAVDLTSVTINVLDQASQRAGFGVPLILEEHTAFANRTKSYTSITEISLDFATTTNVYKAANAIFSQTEPPSTVKVGRAAAGDANLTESLNFIVDEDNDWYCLISVDKTEAEILELAAWTETQFKIFLAVSEDAGIFDSAITTDVVSDLAALNYNRTAILAHHEAGDDSATGSITAVASEVVTVTDVAHGLREGDDITISLGTDVATNGNFVVASVPTADTFTYLATGALDTAIADSIEWSARYTFLEAAWAGEQLPKDPGSSTWKFKTLAGQTAIPKTVLNSSQIATAESKGANVYVDVAGVSMTREGVMVSGRFIDVQRGIDWLDENLEKDLFDLQVNLEKLPYTSSGTAQVESVIRQRLTTAISQGVLNPLSEVEGNLPFIVTVPSIADIPQSDRTTRILTGITFKALVGNAVHGVIVTGTVRV